MPNNEGKTWNARSEPKLSDREKKQEASYRGKPFHVLPVNDIRPHTTEGQCPCGARGKRAEDGAWVLFHPWFDEHRRLAEKLSR